MKALCLLPEVSRPGGVATSKPPLWLFTFRRRCGGFDGSARRGCQRCDELMATGLCQPRNQPRCEFIFCFVSDTSQMTGSFIAHILIMFVFHWRSVMFGNGGGGVPPKLISYVHTHSLSHFMTLAPAVDRRGYLITSLVRHPPPPIPLSPFSVSLPWISSQRKKTTKKSRLAQ